MFTNSYDRQNEICNALYGVKFNAQILYFDTNTHTETFLRH